MNRAERRAAGIRQQPRTIGEAVALNLARQRAEAVELELPSQPDLERVAGMASRCMAQSHAIREDVKRRNMTNMIAAAMASQSRL